MVIVYNPGQRGRSILLRCARPQVFWASQAVGDCVRQNKKSQLDIAIQNKEPVLLRHLCKLEHHSTVIKVDVMFSSKLRPTTVSKLHIRIIATQIKRDYSYYHKRAMLIAVKKFHLV